MLVTWSDVTLCTCPNDFAADGTPLVLHSVQTLLISVDLSKRYKGRELCPLN